MAKAKEHVGFTKSQLNESGGFLDDADVRFTECHFKIFDYGGSGPSSVVFTSTLVNLESDEGYDQAWKVSGKPEDWEIGENGDVLIPITDKGEFNSF